GYHLICDATCASAVARLRARKPRPHKPLAVMFPFRGEDGLAALREYTEPDAAEAAALRDPARPIVLVRRRPDSDLAADIAPGMDRLGAFLPYSPLHHLLLDALDRPLVATSGNLGGEPVIVDAEMVEARLSRIADVFLHHDRPIVRPADDSVVQHVAGRIRPLRLGRGLAPLELRLPRPVGRPTLAVGGHMKNTVALAWDDRLVVSPHIGDLDSPRALNVFEQVIDDLQSLYHVRAERVVCDAHPGYASSRWARASGLPIHEVFHHHAHAAQLALEHPDVERWLVFTWDGVGLGEDGTLWGGEALLGRPGHWRRVASFRPFHPPGGDRVAREPWRSAAALCWAAGLEYTPPQDPELVRAAWERGLNAPGTSAVGRLFDAAAALLGLVDNASFEGQGPMWLETVASHGRVGNGEPLACRFNEHGLLVADWQGLLAPLCDERITIANRAAGFHATLAATLVEQAHLLRERHGGFAVGLSGGVFQNRRLAEPAIDALKEGGFPVHVPAAIPCNDGGLSGGQIIEAMARRFD
ncbi:MAG TPA: carbamoyltransferase HypF, partial [Gammaproteobacteria bacterium]|nr:carbamoyltransferase HypF [Gammaproteobacteria bacterium]